jgi:hypothetical protein
MEDTHMISLRNVLLAVVVAGSLLSFAPAPAAADDYWDGYWGWYDTTYVPAYSRYYSSSRPYYGGYYDSYYAPYYGPPYGRAYGVPRAGYVDYGAGRSAVRVGPVRFGWR